jgi:hypothetical protein
MDLIVMTIAIAIRTQTAVVFAADSKVTTAGIAGYDTQGAPQWLQQTYDNFTKVVYDRAKVFMAVVAGTAQLGEIAATDFIASRDEIRSGSLTEQDRQLMALVEAMATLRAQYWQQFKIDEDHWPSTIVILATASAVGNSPRVWRVEFQRTEPEVQEILQEPWVWMEGAPSNVFTLLYGYDHTMLEALQKELGVSETDFAAAWQRVKILRPIDKLSLGSMPIQDAIELAVFMATTQVQMDRFLPGTPVCGGPIDVMVLRTAPYVEILPFPGKVLHHPLMEREQYGRLP